jgi:hypothetical protein
MQIVLYRPMAADYPTGPIGAGIFAANIIPVGYRGFPADGSFATVFNYGLYVFPLFLSCHEIYAAGGADTPPCYLAVIFFKAAFPRQETRSILLSLHAMLTGFP